MHDFLLKLEETGFAKFIHESSSIWAFPFVLTVHTIGLCLIVGPNSIMSMRLLGLASNLPFKPLRKLFPFMWLGLLLTILSGTALAVAAATIRVLNPLVVAKVVMIAFSAPIMWRIQKKIFDNPSVTEGHLPDNARTLAAAQLFLWILVLTAGRLIAYSATIFGDGH
jgi:hypothetical protein